MIERMIAALAARQRGHVTREQLLELGLGRGAIDWRIRTGRLIVVHAGVYRVAGAPSTPEGRAVAAVLACGAGAVLSHGSAATLWGMARGWTTPLEVTVPADRRPRNIRTHRCSTLTRRDIRRHVGIPVTSPALTLLDNAPRFVPPALARAVNQARLSGHLGIADLDELLPRMPRHPGARALRDVIESSAGPTRSVFEDEFVAFTRRFGLPAPEMNARVAGYEVDALFRLERVIVELDGFAFHGDRGSFERDRDRDAVTLAAGFVTVRVTWERLIASAEREAARLHAILGARRAAAAA